MALDRKDPVGEPGRSFVHDVAERVRPVRRVSSDVGQVQQVGLYTVVQGGSAQVHQKPPDSEVRQPGPQLKPSDLDIVAAEPEIPLEPLEGPVPRRADDVDVGEVEVAHQRRGLIPWSRSLPQRESGAHGAIQPVAGCRRYQRLPSAQRHVGGLDAEPHHLFRLLVDGAGERHSAVMELGLGLVDGHPVVAYPDLHGQTGRYARRLVEPLAVLDRVGISDHGGVYLKVVKPSFDDVGQTQWLVDRQCCRHHAVHPGNLPKLAQIHRSQLQLGLDASLVPRRGLGKVHVAGQPGVVGSGAEQGPGDAYLRHSWTVEFSRHACAHVQRCGRAKIGGEVVLHKLPTARHHDLGQGRYPQRQVHRVAAPLRQRLRCPDGAAQRERSLSVGGQRAGNVNVDARLPRPLEGYGEVMQAEFLGLLRGPVDEVKLPAVGVNGRRGSMGRSEARVKRLRRREDIDIAVLVTDNLYLGPVKDDVGNGRTAGKQRQPTQ